MPNEDFPVISPQGKERNSVCDKIIYFILEACLAVPVLVEGNLPSQAVLINTFHHTQFSVGQEGKELGSWCGFFSQEPFAVATAEQTPQSYL